MLVLRALSFDLVQELQEQMKNQEATIAEMQQAGDTIFASCLQMDVDRVRFMLASYARTRIFKIHKYHIHIEKDEEMQDRMTDHERAWWERYCEMRKKHFNSEVLDYCPVQYNQMDAVKPDYDVDMVDRPKKDQHVFFKALEDLGSVQIGEDDATPVMPDDILCVPYDTIEGFLHGDKQGEGGAAAARGILL
jgi:GINS complex subunit 4